MFNWRKNQFFCFLLIVLSLSSLYCHGVLAARYVRDMKEVAENNNRQIWSKSTSSNNPTAFASAADSDDGGFVATVNREVPSCPDPLHNR
ncbi:CLAVATA3/ESR-RELATED [Melia azedarach]|uniref:CLAVATA3/ESR-RELATED n=1 Tax=Melia azedarach TaxID=155640 RepID=A0ACC1Y8S5_MELAZ|nr:CLAVATA3/ESR-RELATED [Melia azedarach]